MRIQMDFEVEALTQEQRALLVAISAIGQQNPTSTVGQVSHTETAAKALRGQTSAMLPVDELAHQPARVENINANLGAIHPDDLPSTGAPTTIVAIKELGFGSGGQVPPPGAVSVPAPAATPTAPPPAAPAPTPTAPPAPAPTAAPATGAVQLDSKGTPWNKEIHADPATLTEKGVWRARRGVDKDFAAAQAEQLRRMAAASGTGAATAAPVAPPAAAPAAPPAAPAAPPSMFAKFMSQITPFMIGSGQPTAVLSDADLTDIAKTLGLVDAQGNGQVSLLAGREDLIPNFGEWINYKIGQINASRAAG